MKRHIQTTGVRRWAGNDLVELQQQPLQAIDAFFAEYGNCILKGCKVTVATDNTYNISSGFVALAGKDQEDNETFKVVPFAGIEGVTLPIYLTLTHSVIERPYTDGKVKPIAYDFRAVASSIRPEASYLEITPEGGRSFVDAIHLTEKLDKTGNGRDVTITFSQAAKRENIFSGEKLTVLLGKVCKWFSDLKPVAFSGKAADLTEDETHRFLTDTERQKLRDIETEANKYVHPASHPATMITQDSMHRFASDSEKTNWNAKAAASHTHTATQVTEDTTHRFMTDAERTKLSGIETSANKYVHPASHPATMITQDSTHRFASDSEKTIWNAKAAASHTHPATQVTEDTTHRFMTDAERTKLSGIETSANKYVHPASHPATMITDTSTKVMMTPAERTKLAGLASLSKGMIVMWSGAINAVPQGFALCDGQNGTPDLRGRFIVGYAGSAPYAAIGAGSKSKDSYMISLTKANIPLHSHTVKDYFHLDDAVNTFPAGADGYITVTATTTVGNSGEKSTRIYYKNHDTGEIGGGTSFDIRPPYFVLAFIMKL